ncbi:hypothetical protein WMY93_014736 [Mugilogobius chulae]|uniref:Ig-like domain-containing protein n=1 Tax=Mugilogobius chulae TaxID=88201 RepID=A0AAW0NVS5_9GOBI
MHVLVLFLTLHLGFSPTLVKPERNFPRVVPSQLQLFEYSSLTVTCEGFFNDKTKWRVLRSVKSGSKSPCNTGNLFGQCYITTLYPADSGEYWCENKNGLKSEKVRIVVTAGNVTLESPVHPVIVGDTVTLRCIEKQELKTTKFDFYKNGVPVHTSSTGEMTFHNISVSDQGRYKCGISENQFSEENLLRVRAVFLETPDQPVTEGQNVSLFCKDKMAASKYMSFFYKDDKLIGNSLIGKLTLNKVSKSDEGVYKCKTSEDRESEEQWLAVRERTVPRIVLSKRQFFVYTNLTVTCGGYFNDMTKWRVLRSNTVEKRSPCNKNSNTFGSCHIAMLYPADSGEYWCESEDRRRSESVWITVTVANVILESPVHPVIDGDSVTIFCTEKRKKKKTASTKFDFYKDGVCVHTSSTGEMTLHNISVSDQGRYKCNISENKFSEENLLQVKAVFLESPDQPVSEGENVTLFCRDKMAASNYTSLFYKDDQMIGNSSSGTITLDKISKSDEGVYKCQTSEDRESEEQWLAVRADNNLTSKTLPKELFLTALVALPLLLFLLGFIYKKYRERTFPRIVVSKLQYFEYTSLNMTCEGFFKDKIKWRVVRDIKTKNKSPCDKDSSHYGACHIAMLYISDSGEYWCESEDGKSESVTITVTAANVILVSPVRPVMVGDNVTLNCLVTKNYKRSKKFDFYKDGVYYHTSPTGEMTLHNISVSDQGRYKCNIRENKFSEENLLQVKTVFLESPDQPVSEGENVTLFCRDKMAASNYTSSFYKDDEMIGKSSTGMMTLAKVSKSNEGVYKCQTSEDRESEEQWLAVTVRDRLTIVAPSSGDPSQDKRG